MTQGSVVVRPFIEARHFSDPPSKIMGTSTPPSHFETRGNVGYCYGGYIQSTALTSVSKDLWHNSC